MIQFHTSTHCLLTYIPWPDIEPKIKHYETCIDIDEGEELTMKVTFTGFPKPSIEWFFGGIKLNTNPLAGCEMLHDGSLHMRAVEQSHAGYYSFIVSNSLASVEGSTLVNVNVKEMEMGSAWCAKIESYPVCRDNFLGHVSCHHSSGNKGFSAEFQVGIYYTKLSHNR